MKERTLYDNFEIRGQWTLPNSEIVVSGTIYYKNFVITLITEGKLANSKEEQHEFSSEYPPFFPIILGMLSTGEKITLTNTRMPGMNTSYSGLPTCTYYSKEMFIGKHYESRAEIKFKKLYVDYSNLKYWYGITGIKNTLPKFNEESNTFNNLGSVTATIPPATNARISDELQIKIQTLPNVRHHIEEQKTTIEENTVCTFEVKIELHFDEFVELANCYRYFLMLAIGAGEYFVCLEGIGEDNIKVQIFPNTIFSDSLEKRHDFNMLFRYHDIKEKLSEYLQSWYRFWNMYKDIITRYFSTVDSEDHFMLESIFLATAIALDSFHSVKFAKPKCDLTKRIDDLLDYCKYTFDDSDNQKIDFANKVKNTRHYLAHGYDHLKINAITDNTKLFHLTQEMRVLMEECFLRELPFNEDLVYTIMLKNRKEKNYDRDHRK